MKIKEYFTQIKKLRLSPLDVVEIYARISQKQSRQTLIGRRVKYAQYTTGIVSVALLTVLWFSFFFGQQGTPGYKAIFTNDIFTRYQQTPGNFVKATPLWQIISAQGDITFSKGDRVFTQDVTDINPHERIELQAGAEVEFIISNTTKAKIIWPAAFELLEMGESRTTRDITLNVIYGTLIHVTTHTPTTTTTVTSTPQQPNPPDANEVATLTDNVIIKTREFELKRLRASDDIDVVIAVDEYENHTIQNNGGELVVEKFIDNEKVFTAVKSEQVITINEEWSAIASPEQALAISQAIKNQNIVTNYRLEQPLDVDLLDTTDQNIDTDTTATDSVAIDAQTNDEDSSSDTTLRQIEVAPTKKVMTEEQDRAMSQLLHASSLMDTVQRLVTARVNQTANSTQITRDLWNHINRIYDTLDLQLDSQVVNYYSQMNQSLQHLIIGVDQLIVKAEAAYFVWPTYINRMKGLLAWLIFLSELEPDPELQDMIPLTFQEIVEYFDLEQFQGYLFLR